MCQLDCHFAAWGQGMKYALGERRVVTTGAHFIAPGSSVIGSVDLAELVSVWFNVVIRGDNDQITIGRGSNVQDGCVLHVDEGYPLTVGERVTIGHKAMLHGCTIGDGSLIGMNAVVLNGAVIGSRCLIGANALVTEGMQVPDGSLVLGSPGKVVKALSDDMLAGLDSAAQHYIDKITVYSDSLKPME